MDPRAIDPTECWVRHIRRGAGAGARAVATGLFVREDAASGADGLNGRQGWQQANVTRTLSDDSEFDLAMPNVPGDDGVLHRRRFAILTDAAYEPGEEWLEIWSDTDPIRPLLVGTPTDYDKSTGAVTIKGADLTAVLAGSLTSDIDAWDPVAPGDAIRAYTRVPALAGGGAASATVTGAAGAWAAAPYTVNADSPDAAWWEVEAQVRWTSAKPAAAGASFARLDVAGLSLRVDVYNGAVTLAGVPERDGAGTYTGLVVPGPVPLRIVARGERIYAFVNGECIYDFRRPAPFTAPGAISAYAYGGTITIDGIHIETAADFAGADVDPRLPGILPATGLRGRYYNAASINAQNATQAGRVARLFPLLGESDPITDRVDPQLNFPAGTAQYPPGLPGAYAARWTGAIYLDLASTNREIRLAGLVGQARLYIGRATRGVDEAATSWLTATAGTLTRADLRAWLGTSAAGWYPIVVEQFHTAAAAGIVLEDRETGGAWATVPTSRLSPLGCYEDTLRSASHRSIIGDITQAFGYQWRVEPRSFESGEFPGIITCAEIVGRQTDVTVDDVDVGTEAQVSGSAGDVVDQIVADAAGIADPDGSGQLSARSTDYDRAAGHAMLRTSYESLSDISEQPMLATRIDSLLVLRSSPNEQVGVRPRGQKDLVDTLPLTGDLARMDWEPGDGVRLNLDSVDVIDLSPRQMTQVAWSPRRDGLGVPTVGFRQRPRDVKNTLRRLVSAIYAPRRNYQGSIAVATGSLGGATSAGAANGAVDAYSRVPLPANLDDITRVVACVHALAGASWRLEVGGTDLGALDGAVPSAGRYDITRAAKAAPGATQLFARLIGGASGQYQLTLEVYVRV